MRKKTELYSEERVNMFNEILNFINISKENNKIYKSELENDKLKEFINSKMEEIIKYYRASKWASLYREKNRELNVLKNIMREHGIEIYKLEKKTTVDGKINRDRLYIFNFN